MDRDLVSKADLQQMLSVSADIMATIRTLNRFVFNRFRNGHLDAFSIAPGVAAPVIRGKEAIERKEI
jgi:hypothetical protein